VAVHDALKEAGISIPFPQRDLHVRTLPGSETARVSRPLDEDGDSNQSRDDPA